MSIIAAALKHMLASGMAHEAIICAVAEMEENYCVPNVDNRTSAAKRQARYRERMASQNVTNHNENVTSVTDRNETSQVEIEKAPFPSPQRIISNPSPIPENITNIRETEILTLAKPKTSQRSQIAPNAQPTAENLNFAADEGLAIGQIRLEWAKFRDHHRAKANKMADWSAAWRTWVRNSKQFAQPRGSPVPAVAPIEPQNAVIRSLMRQKQREADEQLNYNQ